MQGLTIVMYHYVRDLVRSRYPGIKGLPVSAFRGQLDYLQQHYAIVRMEDVIAAVHGGRPLPGNSCLLTFDDGFSDHFDYVFPVLDERGLQGSFFPPAKAVAEHDMLDVHKIHLILASVADKSLLVKDIDRMLDGYRDEYGLEPVSYYHSEYEQTFRYDTAETIYIKSILQRGVDIRLRQKMTDVLFRKYVHHDTGAIAEELYLSTDQIKCMKRHGMFFGSHAWSHVWLNTISREEQVKEVELSQEFLRSVGCSDEEAVMCYPYGACDESMVAVLKEKKFRLGLKDEGGVADLERDHYLTLPRLDTNEFPREGK